MAMMETEQDSTTYTRYVFPADEFLEKLGLPTDTNVISVEFNWYARKVALVVPEPR
jgi:hypothetical protein